MESSDDQSHSDDSFVPPELAAFVQQADKALSETQQLFLDEASTPLATAADGESDFHGGAETIDVPKRLSRPSLSVDYDSDDLTSPPVGNPAASFTFAEAGTTSLDIITPNETNKDERTTDCTGDRAISLQLQSPPTRVERATEESLDQILEAAIIPSTPNVTAKLDDEGVAFCTDDNGVASQQPKIPATKVDRTAENSRDLPTRDFPLDAEGQEVDNISITDDDKQQASVGSNTKYATMESFDGGPANDSITNESTSKNIDHPVIRAIDTDSANGATGFLSIAANMNTAPDEVEIEFLDEKRDVSDDQNQAEGRKNGDGETNGTGKNNKAPVEATPQDVLNKTASMDCLPAKMEITEQTAISKLMVALETNESLTDPDKHLAKAFQDMEVNDISELSSKEDRTIEAMEIENPPNDLPSSFESPISPTPRDPKKDTRTAAVASVDRLAKPTKSSGYHSKSVSKPKTVSSLLANTKTSRIPKPSPTKVHNCSAGKQSSTAVLSRLLKPTESNHAHQKGEARSIPVPKPSKRSGAGSSHVSSRLLMGTAASTARKTSARRSPTALLPQKRQVGNEAAVTRARERVRQRKEQERGAAFSHDNTEKFNIGSRANEKPRVVRKDRSGSSARLARSGLPHFAMATTAARAHQREPKSSLAQSGDAFGKALRCDTQPAAVSSSSAKQRLTIPETPKFATTAKYGIKKAKKEKEITLAQSTNMLASTLRGGYTPLPASRRTNALTRPQAPRFHTTHKRPLPKSSAEIEEEKISNFKSHPYKTNPKGLHTGSASGLTRVNKRQLTTPAPFKLSSGNNSTKRDNVQGRDAVDEKECKKQFHARPLPKFPKTSPGKPPNADMKRKVTTPEPFRFAVDLKSKSSSVKKASNSPKMFKARPLPKTTFGTPKIPVSSRSPTEKPQSKGLKPVAIARKSPTTPEPFKLESVQRHEAFQELLQEKVASEEEAFQKKLVHKALPVPVTTYKPASVASPSEATA